MRLGFHYHSPAEQRADGIYMPGYLGRFVDSLARRCDEVVCFQHQPRSSQRDVLDSRIEEENVTLVPIGQHCAVWKRALQANQFTHAFRAFPGRIDTLLVRGPSPLLPAFAGAARKRGIPAALLLVGSYVAGVDDLPQPRWRKELIRLYSHLNQWQQDRAAAHSLTFVNSRKLYDTYLSQIPHLVETRTTTLNAQDFYLREDTCQTKQVRLLYTGRFDRSKGLIEIIEALAALVEKGHDLVLDLVGWDDSGTGVIADIQAAAERLGIVDRVYNHGCKTVGPELFAHYKAADIYVIASKNDFEGFPRTVWEAMAHSLPVVATRVGSIPQFVGEAAELVEPRNITGLAEGIENVISDPIRRQRMIRDGFGLARANTLDFRAEELLTALRSWLQGRGA